ncbi:MAG: DNA mismatch repair endonuclease MutL [Lachnospiraceae bacterium]|nr:DNA mismatch repair endonuclease MutL [Lachnospiraceae bacterium]
MSKINILDQDTINKIAAGEVVERPASVVKELVENAIDAGASAVSVYIENGGADLIRITDNGSGFDRDDIRLAFKKNTTSKIKNADDLESVLTFGFRGEALSSIAAVAKVELLTKKAEELTGIRYEISGGEEKSFEDVGCPDGSTLVIRELFFNQPVRRKFLKSATTEAGYVSEVCERIALAHPEIALKFVNGGRQMLATTGSGILKEVVYLIYGRNCAEQLIPVDVQEGDIKVSGVIAKPVISRGNRNHENVFLNGRFVRNSLIAKAVEEGYKTYLMQNRFPLTVLNLEMPADKYDVNVHPAKLEVRFVAPQEVYEAVFKAVFDALRRGESIPNGLTENEKDQRPVVPTAPEPFETRKPEPFESRNPELFENRRPESRMPQRPVTSSDSTVYRGIPPMEVYLPRNASLDDMKKAALQQQRRIEELKNSDPVSSFISKEPVEAKTEVQEPVEPEEPENTVSYESVKTEQDKPVVSEQLEFLSPKARKYHRVIGQVFETSWLVEYDDKLYIIDQHAAHERVLFEKFSKEIRENKVNSQLLYPAPVITLGLSEADKLTRAMDRLNELGYEIEPFGGRQFRILAVPETLSMLDKEELLVDFIDDLTEDMISGTLDSVKDRIATMACKAAVKGNTKLSFEEANKLLDSLLELENPFHCPHGRPIEVSFTKYDIEKMFKRIV